MYLLFPSFLFAQEVGKGQWNFQIKAGGVLTTHKFTQLIVDLVPTPPNNLTGSQGGYIGSMLKDRHKYRVGVNFGLYAEYTPTYSKYFSLIGGISYRQRGFTAYPPSPVDSLMLSNLELKVTNNRLDYLSLDLGFKLKTRKSIYWIAGVRYDYLINKKTSRNFDFYMNYFEGKEFSPFFIQGFNLNLFPQKYTTALELELNPGFKNLNYRPQNDSPILLPFSENKVINWAMSLNLVIGIKNEHRVVKKMAIG
ncbi:outer membrane beta-barrel protein [Thermoflexibacter ruber]|uniref:outer membrane beta-barrel protein n=1 Tax=Thermoflexibacter ruber TaxID=1003 RepID=UPI000B8584CA|nr:hypothetical protein [Thermoflexibacter ruber]